MRWYRFVPFLAVVWPIASVAGAPPVAPSLTSEVSGVALFPGAVVGQTRYGVTFAGTANGETPGLWTVQLNYSPPQVEGNALHQITGGWWQFTRVERGIYKGSLYGWVTEGTIQRDETADFATVEARIAVSGGLGSYAGVTGEGSLTKGFSNHAQFPPTFSGSMNLVLQEKKAETSEGP